MKGTLDVRNEQEGAIFTIKLEKGFKETLGGSSL